MNKFITGLFLILTTAGKTFSQQIQFTSKVTAMYDMYIMFNPFPYNSAVLDFNNSKSLFSYKEQGESSKSKIRSKLIKGSDIGNYILKTDTTIRRIYMNRNTGILLDAQLERADWIIIDTIQSIKWKYIKDTTKKIANYECFMAQGSFRGSVYTVWYAPEIPSSFGPWKLNGCPGLILEATRDDKVLSFYITGVTIEDKDVYTEFANNEIIKYDDYQQAMIDGINEACEEWIAQRKREDDYILPFFIRCLECEFLDKIKRYPNI
jgi:GLPGLI family protein